MSDQNLDYAAIRRKVEMGLHRQKRINRTVAFFLNLLLYVIAMITIWTAAQADAQLRAVLFGGNGSDPSVVLMLPTILWGIAVFFHFVSIMAESGIGEKATRERLLMREVGEEILRKGLMDEGLLEKPKRRAVTLEADRVRLSDDGELVPVDTADRAEPSEWRAPAIHTNHVGRS